MWMPKTTTVRQRFIGRPETERWRPRSCKLYSLGYLAIDSEPALSHPLFSYCSQKSFRLYAMTHPGMRFTLWVFPICCPVCRQNIGGLYVSSGGRDADVAGVGCSVTTSNGHYSNSSCRNEWPGVLHKLKSCESSAASPCIPCGRFEIMHQSATTFVSVNRIESYHMIKFMMGNWRLSTRHLIEAALVLDSFNYVVYRS